MAKCGKMWKILTCEVWKFCILCFCITHGSHRSIDLSSYHNRFRLLCISKKGLKNFQYNFSPPTENASNSLDHDSVNTPETVLSDFSRPRPHATVNWRYWMLSSSGPNWNARWRAERQAHRITVSHTVTLAPILSKGRSKSRTWSEKTLSLTRLLSKISLYICDYRTIEKYEKSHPIIPRWAVGKYDIDITQALDTFRVCNNSEREVKKVDQINMFKCLQLWQWCVWTQPSQVFRKMIKNTRNPHARGIN